jgi:hypothetical protein
VDVKGETGKKGALVGGGVQQIGRVTALERKPAFFLIGTGAYIGG